LSTLFDLKLCLPPGLHEEQTRNYELIPISKEVLFFPTEALPSLSKLVPFYPSDSTLAGDDYIFLTRLYESL